MSKNVLTDVVSKIDSDGEWRITGRVAEGVAFPGFDTNAPSSEKVLTEANKIIHGERAQSYGKAEDSFARIAEFWTTHLSSKLEPGKVVDAYDVAILMTLMKCARAQTDIKQDTFVDIAGYAALAPRCAVKAGR